jgi:hypothetical protein
MALAGQGCFVGWYDLKPGHEAAHDHWHTHEHMIERVAIPGFRRGSRYRSVAFGSSAPTGVPRVCIVYQTDTLETLVSPAYLERLNAPTPWTSRSLPLFLGMNRTLARVVASHGAGLGGTLLTIQLSPAAGAADRLRGWLTAEALPELAARPGLSGAHLLVADDAASRTGSQEKKLRGAPDAVADWVLLVEGYDRAAVEQALAGLVGEGGLPSRGAASGPTVGLYALDFSLGEDEAKRIWKKP